MSIDPNAELFDSSAPAPASAPPSVPASNSAHEDDLEAREREIEGGAAPGGGGGTLHLSVSYIVLQFVNQT